MAVAASVAVAIFWKKKTFWRTLSKSVAFNEGARYGLDESATYFCKDTLEKFRMRLLSWKGKLLVLKNFSNVCLKPHSWLKQKLKFWSFMELRWLEMRKRGKRISSLFGYLGIWRLCYGPSQKMLKPMRSRNILVNIDARRCRRGTNKILPGTKRNAHKYLKVHGHHIAYNWNEICLSLCVWYFVQLKDFVCL